MKYKISIADGDIDKLNGGLQELNAVYGYSDFCNTWFIHIRTLTEMRNLIKKFGNIIIDRERIIIYNDYVE